MNDSDTTRDETAIPIVAVGSRGRSSAAQPELEAMRCLREARVRFAVVTGDPEALLPQPGVGVLVEPGEMEIAAAAVLLRRHGQRELPVRILGLIARLRDEGSIVGSPRDIESQEELKARLERQVGAEEFESVWAEGRAMTL